jgi:hypothetical protein
MTLLRKTTEQMKGVCGAASADPLKELFIGARAG